MIHGPVLSHVFIDVHFIIHGFAPPPRTSALHNRLVLLSFVNRREERHFFCCRWGICKRSLLWLSLVGVDIPMTETFTTVQRHLRVCRYHGHLAQVITPNGGPC